MFALLRQFPFPQDLLPGSLSVSYTRCGRPTCHCAPGERHAAWSLTFTAAGKRRVERIPKDRVDDVRRRVKAGRAFSGRSARGPYRQRGVAGAAAQTAAPLKGPHVRQIQNYASLSGAEILFPTARRQPGSSSHSARDLVWAAVIGHVLRVTSFLRLEWLAHSPVRAESGIRTKFGDDCLAYCTERLDPETTRPALAAALHQAKRNKALENRRFIGLALDGTGAGHTHKQPCPLCDPIKDAKRAKSTVRCVILC